MKKTHEQIETDLGADIPRRVITKRDSGNGKKLDYLEGWYVIDRLNKVFGAFGWSSEIVKQEFIAGLTKPTYSMTVLLTVWGPDGQMARRTGIGYGNDKSGLNPHELASKEAFTDALKRAAMQLGMSMGLALYDKNQENVSDSPESEPAFTTQETKHDATAATTGRSSVRKNGAAATSAPAVAPKATTTPVPSPIAAVPAGVPTGSDTQSQNSTPGGSFIGTDLKKLTDSITAAARVLDKRGTVKITDFATKLKDTYKVTNVTQLGAGQALEIYNNLKVEHPFLGLA